MLVVVRAATLADASVWAWIAEGIAAFGAGIGASLMLLRRKRTREPEGVTVAGFGTPAPVVVQTKPGPPAQPETAPAPMTQPEPEPEPTPVARPEPEPVSVPVPVAISEAPPPLVSVREPGPIVGAARVPPTAFGEGTLRGILRWLLVETDADAVAFLQVAPGRVERLSVEPRGLGSQAISDLADRARHALISREGDEQAYLSAAISRWLGVGGSKVLYVSGVSPVAAAEPIRFARFVVEWMATSNAADEGMDQEDRARAISGVAWAEATADGRLRVMGSEGLDRGATDQALREALPGLRVEWVTDQPVAAGERRAQLLDVVVTLDEAAEATTAEVHMTWSGSPLRGLGHGQSALVGRHLASARAALDALKPVVHGDMEVEHLQVGTLPSEVEVLQVTVLVGEERLVGAVLVRPHDEDRAGARAVLDALNRRLVLLAGQSGRI